jgi:hypothetical protein
LRDFFKTLLVVEKNDVGPVIQFVKRELPARENRFFSEVTEQLLQLVTYSRGL